MPTFGGIVVPTGGAAADGRRTLSDIVNELARPINASDTTVRALAADAFRSAVRTMNRKGCWPWEAQEEDVAITANVSFSTVSSAVKKPLAMHLLSGVAGVRDLKLTYISYDRFMELYDQNLTSQPTVYTLPNLFETGQIQWFPIPSSNDNARLSYYRVTPAPRVESEAVEIPDYVIETYMACAWYEFLKRLPSTQQPFPITVALSEWRMAFREISSHVTSPGDRSRLIDVTA